MINPEFFPGESDAQTSLGFWERNRSPNPGQTTRPSDSQQKKKKKITGRVVDFAVLAEPRLTFEESKKRDEYLEHTTDPTPQKKN